MKTLTHNTTGNYTNKGVKTFYGKEAIKAVNSELKAGKGHLTLLKTITADCLVYVALNDNSTDEQIRTYNDHKKVTIEGIKEVRDVYAIAYKDHQNETLKKYNARFGKLVTYYDDVAVDASDTLIKEVCDVMSQTKLFELIDGYKHVAKGTTPPTEKESDKTTQNGSNDVLNEDVVSVDVDVSKVKEMDAKELQIEFKRLLAQIDIRAVKVDLESIEHEVANQVLATMQTLSALLNTVQK